MTRAMRFHRHAHIVQPNGKRYVEADQITDSVARDPYGIGYNRYRGERPGTKRLPVAATDGGPYVEHTIENVQNRTYPLFSEAYFYTSVKPGTKMNPMVKEFLRFVLSREVRKRCSATASTYRSPPPWFAHS